MNFFVTDKLELWWWSLLRVWGCVRMHCYSTVLIPGHTHMYTYCTCVHTHIPTHVLEQNAYCWMFISCCRLGLLFAIIIILVSFAWHHTHTHTHTHTHIHTLTKIHTWYFVHTIQAIPSLLSRCQRLCVNKAWDALWYMFDVPGTLEGWHALRMTLLF